MYYYQQEDQRQERARSRTAGMIAVSVYAAAVLLLLLLVRFTLEDRSEMGGIMINFGDTEEAAPGSDLASNDRIAEAPQAERRTPAEAEEQEQLTQDFEDAPAVQEKKPKKKPEPKEVKQDTPKPKPAETPVEKPREVNKKALFPGRTEGSRASSDGTGKGAGNQGDPAGTPDGSYDGTGTGTGGTGVASLSGRMLAGALPRPDYNAKAEGRVVVDITVDQQGVVTAATYRPKGSTTSNSVLVNAALRAARQARFNVDENAALSQVGTITYNFRMQ